MSFPVSFLYKKFSHILQLFCKNKNQTNNLKIPKSMFSLFCTNSLILFYIYTYI